MEILTWIQENVDGIFEVATAIIAAASVIAALTPTPKDDGAVTTANSWLSKVRAVVNLLAINVANAKPKK